jgi:AdoMet dependent proline di-methyltransferase
VEPSKTQLDQARVIFQDDQRVEKYYEQGLQEFQFEHTYDVVWVQWVMCYLTDEHMIEFLERSRDSLNS